MTAIMQRSAAARAFDGIAADYDNLFTRSSVGLAQRAAVWKCAERIFTTKGHLLELNCGTGEDAIHFAQQGFHVTSCDVSPEMIVQAQRKAIEASVSDHIKFHVKATETINDLPAAPCFSGVFSNFSGLNCIEDLRGLALSLRDLVLPGTSLLFCFSTRYCLWEILWHLLRFDLKRSTRRWSGRSVTRLGEVRFPVYYPTRRQIERSFAPCFRLVGVYGIGITVPPSYVGSWIERHLGMLRAFERTDTVIRRLPVARVLGDHMLLHFERAR